MKTKKTLLPLGIVVCILAAVFVFMPGGIKGKMLSSDITEKTLTVHSMAGQLKA